MPSNTLGFKLVGGSVASLPFVVGDDDQSIYRWRGARVENYSEAFSSDFPNVEIDSPGAELSFHRAIFSRPQTLSSRTTASRLGKESMDGRCKRAIRFKIYGAFNERDEAEFVIQPHQSTG